jgi:hypothetical protein
MGTCVWCGKGAGLFRREHPACQQLKQLHDSNLLTIEQLVLKVGTGQNTSDDALSRVHDLASQGRIDQDELKLIAERGLDSAVDQLLGGALLSEDQEVGLISLARKLGFTQSELNDSPTFYRIVKNAVLRDLSQARIPERYNLQGRTLFNLQKDEILIWVFNGVTYYEDKTRRSYVGGSHGISMRLAKGFYYHTSSFRGHPVETHGLEMVEFGSLGVTNKNLYLVGPVKGLRIPFTKVVNFLAYPDGFGLFRDVANARQQVFTTGDGWFSYNLVSNLAQLGLEPGKTYVSRKE